MVWGTPEARDSLDAVRAIRLSVPGGSTVPLSAVADVAIAPVQNEITRENGARRIDVTCNVSGRDLGSVARDITARLATLDLGAGYHAEVLGEYAAREASSRSLLMWGGVALVGILLILLTDFGTVRLTALVFLTLPFALVGAIAAALLTGGVLSLGSLVGLVTVIGIAARNGIMLVSHYRHCSWPKGVPFGRELVLRGAEERLVPDPDDGASRPAWRSCRLRSAATRPGTKSSIRWPSSSSAGWSHRRCSTCSSCRRCTCASGGKRPPRRTRPWPATPRVPTEWLDESLEGATSGR